VNAEQSKRFGQLLAMGVPLPIAAAIAIDPEAAQAGAVAGAQSFIANPSAGIAQFEQIAPVKRKRRVSQYQRRWGANLKRLKAKHPRTSHASLMRQAHRQTRKEMKK